LDFQAEVITFVVHILVQSNFWVGDHYLALRGAYHVHPIIVLLTAMRSRFHIYMN